jgi:2-dehydropantoate 2-reductase
VSEAVAVAAADGAALGDDDVRAVMATYTGDWSTQSSGSSMYYDRVAGRPLEHEALTGALVETGCRLGVRVPHHETVLALLRVLDPASEGALYRSGG